MAEQYSIAFGMAVIMGLFVAGFIVIAVCFKVSDLYEAIKRKWMKV